MKKEIILAIDQGTTGSTALLLDHSGKVIGSHNQTFPQIYPKNDWVEHDPKDIWISVVDAVKNCLSKSNVDGHQISCIGITNQRETSLLWNKKSGKTQGNAIVWQCKRTIDFCENLKKQGLEDLIHNKTGLFLDPYFSGSKYNWLLNNFKDSLDSKDAILGTIDTYLVYLLTGKEKIITEPSNASRTLLCNIKTGQWDTELLDIFKIPIELLPTIHNSNEKFGVTKGLDFLPDGIPINGILGDQQAALFGQTCFAPNETKCTYGTGAFIMMNIGETPKFSDNGLLTTIACKTNDKIIYALEGTSFIAGAAVQWLRDGLGIIDNAQEIEALAEQCQNSEEVSFIPALAGLGSPYWKPNTKGSINGLTRSTTKAHIARATLEGIALQNRDIIVAMEKEQEQPISKLLVDGGAASNKLLMQIQADVLQTNLYCPQNLETTAIGAAYMAGFGAGIWENREQLRKLHNIANTYEFDQNTTECEKLIRKWDLNIKRLLVE
ncbi:MAG: glycerol kinase [Planctomycetota bacterium]|nr:MAG: glycerol kinase [Planctomycetota bacterium]